MVITTLAEAARGDARPRPAGPSGQLLFAFGVVAAVVALVMALEPAGARITASNAIGKALLIPLLGRFPHDAAITPANYAGIIVLGGSWRRTRYAAHIAARFPHLAIVVSGETDRRALAEFTKASVDPAWICFERRARNTWENGLYTRRLLGDQHGRRWLLVTSDFHAPRAVGVFRRLGIDATPMPVEELQLGSQRWLHHALHEWLGLLSYWVEGRTTALLPSPY